MSKFDINAPVSTPNPFVVPEGYFSQFPARLMQRIHSLPQPESTATMRLVRWLPFIGVASVAAMLLLFMHVAAPSTLGNDPASAPGVASTASQTDEAYDYLILSDDNLLTSYANDN